MIIKVLLTVSLLGLIFIPPTSCFANVGEAFGFGSRSAALAGTTTGLGLNTDSDAYAAYSNPASLPLPGNKRLTLSWGLMDMEPRFRAITNVVIENDYTSDRLTSGDVDTTYRSTLGQSLGLSYVILPHFFHLTFGMTTFFPINQLAYLDTGETFIPEYVLYRARTQRPQVEFGVGMELIPGVFMGVGLHTVFSLTTNGTLLLQTDTSKPSNMRFSASMKPKASPVLGLLLAPGRSSKEPGTLPSTGDFNLGAVIRFPAKATNTLTMSTGARALGNLPILDFNFSALSTLFYDPLTLEIGGSLAYTQMTRLVLQADYQLWSQFETPALSIESPKTQNGGVNFSPSQNPTFEYQNILIPRIAHEISFETWSIRLGYAYRPSFLKNIPTDAGNYLDPPKHMYTAGAGFKFRHFLGFDTNCQLDFHAALHQLITQTITKTPGDEKGTGSGNTKNGAPSYEAGGKILGGGVSLSLNF